MEKLEVIKAQLRAAGVPRYVFKKTLISEGASNIREFLEKQGYKNEEGCFMGVYIYPKESSPMVRAHDIFFTVAKEMVLLNLSVSCLSLVELRDTLMDVDYAHLDCILNDKDMIFIIDFYENIPSYLDGYALAKVKAWISARTYDGKGVSMVGAKPLPDTKTWWPESFVAHIATHVKTFPV